MIYINENFVALGIDGIVMYRMNWDNVEDYFI